MDCVFCKIVAGEIPCKKAYEDELVLAFYDIAPQAETHILIIPKEHTLSSAGQVTMEDAPLLAHIFGVAAELSQTLGFTGGYRLCTNVGEDAGQTVFHLHFHLLAGEKLGRMA